MKTMNVGPVSPAAIAVVIAIALGFAVQSPIPADRTVMAQTSRAPAVFIVTNTNDSGAGSLRAAITAANADTSADSADTIVFDIDGPPPHIIKPLQGMPTITGPLTIDGFCQSCDGATPNTTVFPAALDPVYTIVVSGEDRNTGSGNAFTVNSALPVTIRGLVIHSWQGSAVNHTGGAGHIFAGNYIGTDHTGLLARPNGTGITVHNEGVTIGGPSAADRNLISASNNNGILTCLTANPEPTSLTLVQGNFIGTDRTGMSALGNGFNGIWICNDSDWLVQDNLISASGQDGLTISTSSRIRVLRNVIGLNREQSAAMGNGQVGIEVTTNSSDITIGEPGNGNVIAGNDDEGIYVVSALGPVSILGNSIGVSSAGLFGNGLGGIRTFNTQLVAIGDGTAAGANTIAGNGTTANPSVGPGGAGVYVFSNDPASITRVVGNVIHSNSGLPIDLGGGAGPTPNDVGDGDTGGNMRQNFPTLAAAVRFDQGVHIQANLGSSPNGTFSVDVYSSPSCPSGKPELRTYLGRLTLNTAGDGNGSAAAFVALAPLGHFVTSLALDADGRTSEAGPCIEITERPSTDVNCDGAVDSLDVLAILRYLAGFGEGNLARTCNVDPITPYADANGDSEESVADAVFVRRNLAGLGP